jgi:LysM repeat protein
MSNNEIIEYSIQPGDTLWDLAEQYDTNVDDIMALNPDIDPYNLQVGQMILIDPPPPRTSQRRPGERPGERRPGGRPGERRPEYRRPPYRPAPYRPYYGPPVVCRPGATPYSVQPGDSLYGIAARFGISINDILAVNPYINFGSPLYIGQIICLPI